REDENSQSHEEKRNDEIREDKILPGIGINGVGNQLRDHQIQAVAQNGQYDKQKDQSRIRLQQAEQIWAGRSSRSIRHKQEIIAQTLNKRSRGLDRKSVV